MHKKVFREQQAQTATVYEVLSRKSPKEKLE
jgi:hypothetical protein